MKTGRSDYNNLEGKIPADEPVFVLRGQDELSVATIEFYAMMAQNNGRTDIAATALNHADAMRQWPVKKLPDLPPGVGVGAPRLRVGDKPLSVPKPVRTAAAQEVTLSSLRRDKASRDGFLGVIVAAGVALLSMFTPAEAQVDSRGWMVIAGSWPLSRGGVEAKINHDMLKAASCSFRAQAGRSDELIASVGPNRAIVFVGPYRSRGQAMAALAVIRRCLPDAYVTPGIDTVAEDH
jgi:hypothetical protein